MGRQSSAVTKGRIFLAELVSRLNPQRTLAQLGEDIVSIGYPTPT